MSVLKISGRKLFDRKYDRLLLICHMLARGHFSSMHSVESTSPRPQPRFSRENKVDKIESPPAGAMRCLQQNYSRG